MPRLSLLILLVLSSLTAPLLAQTPRPTTRPPFSGTVFIAPELITKKDPSSFRSLKDAGQGLRKVFDRRSNSWENVEAFLFIAKFSDHEQPVEIIVNPEFLTQSIARQQARKYALAVGRIPRFLKVNVDALWIHKGDKRFGGGNRSILIHTDKADEYADQGVLEEALLHEGAHTSLDWAHGGVVNAAKWRSAQQKDGQFISSYAQEDPKGEDVAESLVPYLIVRLGEKRVSPELIQTIKTSIPNRLRYLDSHSFRLTH